MDDRHLIGLYHTCHDIINWDAMYNLDHSVYTMRKNTHSELWRFMFVFTTILTNVIKYQKTNISLFSQILLCASLCWWMIR
jgi:hypothetical protein